MHRTGNKRLLIALIGLFLTISLLPQARPAQALASKPVPFMVKDIIPGPGDSNPKNFLEYHGQYYFQATDDAHGAELWVSDLTPGGTHIVKDIVPGTADSTPSRMVVFNDKIYFYANFALWVSDGTPEGTVEVKAFADGEEIYRLAATSSVLFISTYRYASEDSSVFGNLYVSNGTSGGTLPLVEETVTLDTPGVYGLVTVGEYAYYLYYNAIDSGFEPWRSDGTQPGTTQLAETVDGVNLYEWNPDFTPYSGGVYFIGGDQRIRRTNGANATTQVIDMPADNLEVINDQLYFAGNSGSGTASWDVWSSNGTPQGTNILKTFGLSYAPYLYTSNQQLIFETWLGYYYGSADSWEIWGSNGTPGGTVLLKSFEINQIIRYYFIDPVTGSMYFICQNGFDSETPHTWVVWKTDGTIASTTPVFSVPDAGLSSIGRLLFVHDGLLLFSGYNVYDGSELWAYDPLRGGNTSAKSLIPYIVRDINMGVADSYPNGLVAYHGKYYFRATDAEHGTELWVTDLTSAGTKLVKDLNPGSGSSNLSYMVVFKDKLYFKVSGTLWTSDGTPDGTVAVKTFPNSAYISKIAAANNSLFISTRYNDTQNLSYDTLYASDGTDAGTIALKAASPTSYQTMASGIGSLTTIGDIVYFPMYDNTTGVEPWRSDGTVPGTYMLAETVSGSTNIEGGSNFTALNGSVYFIGGDRRIWKTDGTNPAARVVDIESASLTAFKGSLYFFVNSGLTPAAPKWDPYIWDGTTADPQMIKAFGFPEAVNFYSTGQRLLFSDESVFYWNNEPTWKIWATDGTSDGTQIIRTFAGELEFKGFINDLGNGDFYFLTLSGSTWPPTPRNYMIWKSDGTESGTVSLFPTLPTNGLTQLSGPLAARDGILLFSGFDPNHGNELWVLGPTQQVYLPFTMR